jgi:alpha-mannosidase
MADGREVPALRWADLSENRGDHPFGLSLLNNGRYGHQAHGNTLGLTLVRASYEPDVNPDERLHRFAYSLYPHSGSWQSSGTLQQAAGFNQGVLVTITSAHSGPNTPGQAGLSTSTPQIVISAVKLAEDQPEGQSAIIVRLYEAFGQPCEAALHLVWPVQQVEEVNLMEEIPAQDPAPLTIAGDAVWLTFKPHEIKTLRMI